MKSTGRKIVSVILAVMILMSVSLVCVSADTYIVEDGFKFARENGYVTIHGYEGSEANVTVPSSLVGQSVTSVYEYAFMYEDTIKSMTLPNTITSVGRGAFYGCTSLETVTLPKNCTNIGQYMFYACSSLKSVTLPTMLKEVPRYCFAHCDSIETISLPSTAKVIGDYAFSDCPNLKSVYVSRYTNSISLTAFEDCPQAVIYGYMNTYAHQFAIENSIPFSAIDANAQTLYVTFYNYDGSIYLKVPVTKGSSIGFPAAPEKPSTSKYDYEFQYWDGNVMNIQQNEFLYPVYEEVKRTDIPAVVNKYSVIFLNADDIFLEAQTVEECCDATAPSITPRKDTTSSHYYEFVGWDKSFSGVTQDLVVRPVFEEYIREFTVKFVSTDDEVIYQQVVKYGESVTAPEPVEYEGFIFTGWDNEYSFVSEDMIIRAVYQKIETPEEEPQPLPVKTTGKLRIELSGGNRFTIAVNDAAARPQGASYVNTKMPIGATVTIVADTSDEREFLGWMNESGAVVSTTDTYTFTATGNDYFKAVYITDVEGVNVVAFKNSRAAGGRGQIIDMQYYSAQDDIDLPDAPTLAGYVFIGWNMTAEEIKAELSQGNDVTVVANWERAKVYIDVNVTGGTIKTPAQPNGMYFAYGAVTVVADAAPEGQKFAYWTDESGKIMSYNAEYKFFPSADTCVIAVFAAEDEVVEKQPLVFIAGDPTTEGEKITYTISWDVDASVGSVTNYGIVAIDETDYNADTFYHGSGDSKLFDRAASATTQIDTKSLSLGNRYYDHSYYAKAFVIYTDAVTGQAVTLYSDVIITYKPAP